MKKFMSICMVMVIIVTALFGLSVTTSAESISNKFEICGAEYPVYTYNGYKYVIYNSDTIIIDYNGNERDVVIPSKIGKYTITMIWKESFHSKSINTITIPKTVNKIGIYRFSHVVDGKWCDPEFSNGPWSAFDLCSNLKNIYVQKGNKTFKDISGILYNVTNNEKILEYYPKGKKAPKNIPEGTTSIGDAFSDRKDLIEITFPKTLKSIGCFANCTNLKKVTFNEGLESIGNFSFDSCTSLESISIPDSVTSIGVCAFLECKNLKTVTFGKNLKTIDEQVFKNCTNLKKVTFNEGLESIGRMAFNGCTSLESISIPDSVTSIGGSCFEDCKNLKNVTLGENLKTIGGSAFNKCSALTQITIPNSVKKIGMYAFIECTSLESANINAKVIDDSAFLGCEKLKKVTFGENVKTIGPRTFLECNSLESISIPNRVTSIGDHAFVRCAKLKNVTIGANVESIGMGAFCNCPIESLIFKGNNVNINGSFDWNKIKKIYFCGNKNDWNKISRDYNGTIYYNCKFATITKQPTSVKAASGKKVKLIVAATGSGLKYQWQYIKNGKWVNIKNGTNPTITVKMSESAVRTWRCVISDKYGTTDISKTVKTMLK